MLHYTRLQAANLTAKLHHLLHGLPQELFDKIYDLTFAVDPTTAMDIGRFYKPPVQLQINHATREDFAKRYYASEAGFRLKDRPESSTTLFRWLSTLPASHQRRIDRIDVSNLHNFFMHSKPRRVKECLKIFSLTVTTSQNVHLKSRSVLQIDFVDAYSGEEMRMSAEGEIVRQ